MMDARGHHLGREQIQTVSKRKLSGKDSELPWIEDHQKILRRAGHHGTHLVVGVTAEAAPIGRGGESPDQPVMESPGRRARTEAQTTREHIERKAVIDNDQRSIRKSGSSSKSPPTISSYESARAANRPCTSWATGSGSCRARSMIWRT